MDNYNNILISVIKWGFTASLIIGNRLIIREKSTFSINLTIFNDNPFLITDGGIQYKLPSLIILEQVLQDIRFTKDYSNRFEIEIILKHNLLENQLGGDLYQAIRKHLQKATRNYRGIEVEKYHELKRHIRKLKPCVTSIDEPFELEHLDTDDLHALLCYVYANGYFLDYLEFVKQGIPGMIEFDDDDGS